VFTPTMQREAADAFETILAERQSQRP